MTSTFIFLVALLSSLFHSSEGFAPTPSRTKSITSLSSYLDSLSSNNNAYPSAPPATDVTTDTEAPQSFYHAPKSFFSLPNLTAKGPRTTADIGTPHEGTRKLIQLDQTRAGSWSCTEGGWPSPNPKAHTEIFYVWDGHGCLTDGDGEKHYFGPGDTVIIPKGHTGRWDVLADMHKIWFVNDHENVEDESNPIRVRIIHYHDLVSVENQINYGVSKGAVRGNPVIYSNVFYNAGANNVGSWMCTPGCFNIHDLDTATGFYVLEGLFYLFDAESGQCSRCGPGDTVMLPKGWSGSVDVVETAKKLWTNYLSSY